MMELQRGRSTGRAREGVEEGGGKDRSGGVRIVCFC